MNDFSADIEINKYQLDEELVRQPQLYYDWAKSEVIAADKVARAKDDWEVTAAEIEIEIRKHPTLYNLPDNPKEGLVKAAVIIHKKVKRKKKKYLKALKTQRLLAKAERSFEHRKKSLEGLVSVNMQMHFSTPKQGQRVDLEIKEQQQNLLGRERQKRKIKRR